MWFGSVDRANHRERFVMMCPECEEEIEQDYIKTVSAGGHVVLAIYCKECDKIKVALINEGSFE